MKVAAILLAAGRGERLGSDVPKAFAELEGRPLLAHALATLHAHPAIGRVVLTAPEGWLDRASEIAGPGVDVLPGGPTRQRSVALALEVLARGTALDAVVCHDAARPRARPELFDAVLRALERADGAVPGIPVADTLKRVQGGRVAETLPRDHIVRVQTPQAFRWEALRRAHERAGLDGVDATDDAALLERLGLTVVVVEGDPANVKVTTAGDLEAVGSQGDGGG